MKKSQCFDFLIIYIGVKSSFYIHPNFVDAIHIM